MSPIPFASDPDPRIGQAVRLTGGKFNGFEGQLVKAADTAGAVLISFEGRLHEVVVDLAHVVDLTLWRAGKSTTELQLRGGT